jgi:hypothetical protein
VRIDRRFDRLRRFIFASRLLVLSEFLLRLSMHFAQLIHAGHGIGMHLHSVIHATPPELRVLKSFTALGQSATLRVVTRLPQDPAHGGSKLRAVIGR